MAEVGLGGVVVNFVIDVAFNAAAYFAVELNNIADFHGISIFGIL